MIERFEDIEIDIRALNGDDEASRVLEQVKYRGRSKTLLAGQEIEAIANTVSHFHLKADSANAFQFTTNAQIGREELSLMPGSKLAIAVWKAVTPLIRPGKIESKSTTS